MFKPVTGDQLGNFDPETIDLYSKKSSDPFFSFQLSRMPRRARHHLPVIVDKENAYLSQYEAEHETFWWKYMLSFGFFGNFNL